jgi:hypothetical protein
MSPWIRIGGTATLSGNVWLNGRAVIRRTNDRIGRYQVTGVDAGMSTYRTLAEAQAAAELALSERERTT